jgi:hypothetical protein
MSDSNDRKNRGGLGLAALGWLLGVPGIILLILLLVF